MRSTTANPSKLVLTVLLFAVIIIIQLCLILFLDPDRKLAVQGEHTIDKSLSAYA